MQNNTHVHANSLEVFGWNFSLIADLQITTDKDGNIYLPNSGIESLLPQQLPGTALYDTDDSPTTLDELIRNPYRLNGKQLIQSYSANQRIFIKQADGSFKGNSSTLTWKVNHYELAA